MTDAPIRVPTRPAPVLPCVESVLEALRDTARVLHRRVSAGDPEALARIRRSGEWKGVEDATLAADAQRRHALTAVAREAGFGSWPHLAGVLAGENDDDFGTLLVPKHFSAHWNIWSAHYDEARAIRAEHGGYLLAYKRQFLITDGYFIEARGLDPEAPEWETMKRDWARAAGAEALEARARLYGVLLRAAVEAA